MTRARQAGSRQAGLSQGNPSEVGSHAADSRAASPRDGRVSEQERHLPLYARALRLKHLTPSGFLCFAFLEGATALGILLALAELVSWWGVVVLPATVAVMVKLNDVVAGMVSSAAPPPRPASSVAIGWAATAPGHDPVVVPAGLPRSLADLPAGARPPVLAGGPPLRSEPGPARAGVPQRYSAAGRVVAPDSAVPDRSVGHAPDFCWPPVPDGSGRRSVTNSARPSAAYYSTPSAATPAHDAVTNPARPGRDDSRRRADDLDLPAAGSAGRGRSIPDGSGGRIGPGGSGQPAVPGGSRLAVHEATLGPTTVNGPPASGGWAEQLDTRQQCARQSATRHYE